MSVLSPTAADAGPAPAAPRALAVSPHGALCWQDDPEGAALAPAAARRLEQAFAEGPGPGLLHLGAVEVQTALPPGLAYFRELSKRFLSALCAVPDLEEQAGSVQLPLSPADAAALAERAPPMTGAEYLNAEVLQSLWGALHEAFRADLARSGLSVAAYLQQKNPVWTVVGRVCLNLAENRKSEDTPFAFMATYASRVTAHAKVQHLKLGDALREYTGAGDKQRLLSLLQPVLRAAEKSALLKDLVDSGSIYRPLAWTAQQAYRFLKEVPAYEESGLVVRIPNWWRAKPRPQVSITVGERPSGHLSADALLDFSVKLTLGGEQLTEAEWRALMAGTDGLTLLKGQWVEVDRDRLQEVLGHWKRVQRETQGGLSFGEAMRLVTGATTGSGAIGAPAADQTWTRITPGEWLSGVLKGLRDPSGLGAADPGPALKATLRHYQQDGVKWLWFLNRLGLGACLADDMGLGKTIQVLALLLLMRQHGDKGPHLLAVPASLLGNWQAEIERFAPSLRYLVAHQSALAQADLQRLSPAKFAGYDLVLVSYGALTRMEAVQKTDWGLVVLDEAQAIKNPGTKQTQAAKALRSQVRLALTGTPVENRLTDLWSLYDFLSPGLLGSAREFAQLNRHLAETGDYGPLRGLVRPYLLRRLKSDKNVIADLPDKTEVQAFCLLSKKQAALYQQAVAALAEQLDEMDEDGLRRRGVILAFLLRFKQICNHPDQWLGSGGYDPADSGKMQRLRELCEPIAERQEKVLVFTQFREMTRPLCGFLEGLFGRRGLVLDGNTPVKERRALVEAFQSERAGSPPFFVLSLKAGGTGLNLTAAAHVIHFDRWWNPAVEDQATDRAYRIGQRRNVLVHKFVCRGTIEERIDKMIRDKQGLSAEILQGGGEVPLTEMSDEQLMGLVSLDIRSALGDA